MGVGGDFARSVLTGTKAGGELIGSSAGRELTIVTFGGDDDRALFAGAQHYLPENVALGSNAMNPSP